MGQAVESDTGKWRNLDAVADRGYFSSEEILECENAGITVTLPKPMTSNSNERKGASASKTSIRGSGGCYVCPAGQKLAYSFTTEDKGLVLRRYRTNACQSCTISIAAPPQRND